MKKLYYWAMCNILILQQCKIRYIHACIFHRSIIMVHVDEALFQLCIYILKTKKNNIHYWIVTNPVGKIFECITYLSSSYVHSFFNFCPCNSLFDFNLNFGKKTHNLKLKGGYCRYFVHPIIGYLCMLILPHIWKALENFYQIVKFSMTLHRQKLSNDNGVL
jgi:hypothetical protein